jgi:hypothetical protein
MPRTAGDKHAPVLQAFPAAQVVPLAAAFGPVSLQTPTPVEQTREPVSQTFVGVHAAPVVHALHEPSWQTRFVPHEVPFVRLLPVSVHVGVPVAQLSVPL